MASPHGEPQAQPSLLTGAASSEARRGKNRMKTSQRLCPTLDLGRHRHARHEPLPEAGAERTLEAVGSMPLLGAGSERVPALSTYNRCLPHSTLELTPLVVCDRYGYRALQWQHLHSVVPFLGVTGGPNEEQLLYRSTNRQFLWDNNHTTTDGMPNEFCKVCGHGFAVVRDQYSPCLGRPCQHLWIR